MVAQSSKFYLVFPVSNALSRRCTEPSIEVAFKLHLHAAPARPPYSAGTSEDAEVRVPTVHSAIML